MSSSQTEHPEWDKENSLTSPIDRDREKKWRPEQGAPNLNENEVECAMKSLNNTSFIDKFPRVDRTYADSPVPMQNIGLISFTPAKGASPNENGVFGFAKLRGNYGTSIEANQRAEHIIRNTDSYHQIYHSYVGRPFPITFSSKYSEETEEIDIRRETTNAISGNIKKQKEEEQKTVSDMKEREKTLMDESKRARDDDGLGEPPTEDPYEEYITQSVKKAQLSWTFLEHLKKLEEVREIIINTRKVLSDLDNKHPEFKEKYFDKYMDARRKAGLDENKKDIQDNFMKYMIEEVNIPTIDTDEVLPVIKPNRDIEEKTDKLETIKESSEDNV